jgi:hypothetical protein
LVVQALEGAQEAALEAVGQAEQGEEQHLCLPKITSLLHLTHAYNQVACLPLADVLYGHHS